MDGSRVWFNPKLCVVCIAALPRENWVTSANKIAAGPVAVRPPRSFRRRRLESWSPFLSLRLHNGRGLKLLERLPVNSLVKQQTNHASDTIVTVSNHPQRNGLTRGWTDTARPSRRSVQGRPLPSRSHQWRRDNCQVRGWGEVCGLWARM